MVVVYVHEAQIAVGAGQKLSGAGVNRLCCKVFLDSGNSAKKTTDYKAGARVVWAVR